MAPVTPKTAPTVGARPAAQARVPAPPPPAPAIEPKSKGWGAPPGGGRVAQKADGFSSATPVKSAASVPTTPAQAKAFASQLVKDLGQIPLDRQGSSAVAHQLQTHLRTRLQDPKLSTDEKLKVVGDTLRDLLEAGRGPAMQGISDFLGLAPKLGIPIDADLRKAMGDALVKIEERTVDELGEQGGVIASRAGLPPDKEGQVDFQAVRDLAQMSRTLNRGGETERARVVTFVLGQNDKSVIGRVGAAMHDVVFKNASKVLTFSQAERTATQKLLKAYTTADRSSRAQLEHENGPLLAKLEKVAGGLMADSPRTYLDEQRAAGRPELSVMSDPTLTNFHENLNIAQTVTQVRQQLDQVSGAR